MKRTHRLALAAVAIIPLATLILIAGCESSKDYMIDVTPPFADLTEGNHRVTLSATGWSDYTWELDKPKIGFLSAKHGESVIYSAVTFPEAAISTKVPPPAGTNGNSTASSTSSSVEPEIQTVKVSARNIVSGTGSNNVSHAYTGEVIIRHMPKKIK